MPTRNVKSTGQKKLENNAFDRGYVCACAAIITTHGADVIARDVLGCNVPNWSKIDDYDRDILAKVGLAPRRRKSRQADSVHSPSTQTSERIR